MIRHTGKDRPIAGCLIGAALAGCTLAAIIHLLSGILRHGRHDLTAGNVITVATIAAALDLPSGNPSLFIVRARKAGYRTPENYLTDADGNAIYILVGKDSSGVHRWVGAFPASWRPRLGSAGPSIEDFAEATYLVKDGVWVRVPRH